MTKPTTLYRVAVLATMMLVATGALAQDTALPPSLPAAVLAQVWPPQIPRSPDTGEVVAAMQSAVEAEAAREPALTSHTEDFAAGVFTAYYESALHAHAAGDCKRLAHAETVRDPDGSTRVVWHPEEPIAPGRFPDGNVPRDVLCMAHGAWQQTAACGRADVNAQARCWLAELHRSAKECPAHPMASLVSGGKGCSLGTKLSDWRLGNVRAALSKAMPLAME